MTDTQIAELADGIMSVPAIGATLCAALALANLGETREILKALGRGGPRKKALSNNNTKLSFRGSKRLLPLPSLSYCFPRGHAVHA
eukprot:5212294-Amphidinium_carterae.1